MLKRSWVLVALVVLAAGCGYELWGRRPADPPMTAAAKMVAAGNLYGAQQSNATALFYHAVLMMRAGLVVDAGVELDKLGTAIDQFPQAHFYKAQVALTQGNRQSALESFRQFLRLEPADPDGVRLAAQIEMDLGRPDRAVTVLSGLRARDAEAVDLEGRALFMMGRTTDAVASFRQATALAPDNQAFASHLAAAQTDFGDASGGADRADR